MYVLLLSYTFIVHFSYAPTNPHPLRPPPLPPHSSSPHPVVISDPRAKRTPRENNGAASPSDTDIAKHSKHARERCVYLGQTATAMEVEAADVLRSAARRTRSYTCTIIIYAIYHSKL